MVDAGQVLADFDAGLDNEKDLEAMLCMLAELQSRLVEGE